MSRDPVWPPQESVHEGARRAQNRSDRRRRRDGRHATVGFLLGALVVLIGVGLLAYFVTLTIIGITGGA